MVVQVSSLAFWHHQFLWVLLWLWVRLFVCAENTTIFFSFAAVLKMLAQLVLRPSSLDGVVRIFVGFSASSVSLWFYYGFELGCLPGLCGEHHFCFVLHKHTTTVINQTHSHVTGPTQTHTTST